MVGRLNAYGIDAVDVEASEVLTKHFDIAVWVAGYEIRASWLIKSSFCPENVGMWYRVEFIEGRSALAAPDNIAIGKGELLGPPGHVHWDGYWLQQWKRVLKNEYEKVGRKLDVFVDISSMPRTVYGPLFIYAIRNRREYINSITLAYVPGMHDKWRDGSIQLNGLRPLAGTEGAVGEMEETAAVFGLGYDGILAETIIDLFQFSHVSAFYADPGATSESVERALSANRSVIAQCEMVARAPAWSCAEAAEVCLELSHWYLTRRDVILIVLGPKPHVIGGMLAASACPRIAFRFPRTSVVPTVQVTVAPDAVPSFSRISFVDT